jgi:transcriptional regulator with XRE-family HTH domain
MSQLVKVMSENIYRLREFKKRSQKEVALQVGIPQGQYSRIENGKVEPTLTTLEKIAIALEVSLSQLIEPNQIENDTSALPLWEKIQLLEKLEQEEKTALFTVIDMAIAKKRLKDNLSHLLAQ